ncbi:MAG: GDSL-type esterase/lipase family protein [Deltaproteobacteria bacterium]|nr:GDSL-type esterase/lipase family protein [Deltaproteobacteria bacterium]
MLLVQLFGGEDSVLAREEGIWPHDGLTIVMLGDSLTAGGRWRQLRQGAEIYNMGVPGDTTSGLWSRVDEALEKKPDFIFLQIGINDLGQGRSAGEIVEQSVLIWQEIKEKAPRVGLFVCSLIPVRESYFSNPPRKLKNSYIREVNRQLSEAARKEGVTFIDLFFPLLGSDSELPAALTFDGVHLQAPAYNVWLKTIRPFLP